MRILITCAIWRSTLGLRFCMKCMCTPGGGAPASAASAASNVCPTSVLGPRWAGEHDVCVCIWPCMHAYRADLRCAATSHGETQRPIQSSEPQPGCMQSPIRRSVEGGGRRIFLKGKEFCLSTTSFARLNSPANLPASGVGLCVHAALANKLGSAAPRRPASGMAGRDRLTFGRRPAPPRMAAALFGS